MSSIKRVSEMISSIGESKSLEAQDEANKKRKLETESFAEFLDNHIPSYLLPAKASHYLAARANRRLSVAIENDVNIKDIRIGMDCLPKWPGVCWDPEEEGLGVHIQSRLLDYEVSRDVRFLRNQLIAIGNKRLNQAAALGLGVRDLSVGSDLLPSWSTTQPSDEAMVCDADQSKDIEIEPNTQIHASTPPWEHHPQSVSSTQEPEPSDTQISTDNDYFDDNTNDSAYDSFTSDGASSTSDSDTEEGSINDTISLNNFVDSTPSYYEPSCAGTEHVFHDAEIVGVPEGSGEVDLEVFVVDGDDSDLEDMPEMEMGIDRLGFELYFHTDEAVDIDMSGVEVRCSTDLPISDQPLKDEVTGVEMTGPEEQIQHETAGEGIPKMGFIYSVSLPNSDDELSLESEEE